MYIPIVFFCFGIDPNLRFNNSAKESEESIFSEGAPSGEHNVDYFAWADGVGHLGDLWMLCPCLSV